MKEMSPCLVLPFQNAYLPLQFTHVKLDVPLEEVVFKGAAQPSADEQALWQSLRELAARPPVAVGTATELLNYQRFVKQHIEVALSAARVSPRWEAASGVTERLDKAFDLVNSNKTSQGRQLALEVLGFASLAYKSDTASADSGCWSICSSSRCVGDQFKVPALPAKRPRESKPEGKTLSASSSNESNSWQLRQANQLPGSLIKQQAPLLSSHQQQHQPRRHSAPKRRATPQVMPGAPSSIVPAAPPTSGLHGEACCDEQLLSTWCPISGNRQCTPSQLAPSFDSTNSGTTTSEGASSSRPDRQQLLQNAPAAQQDTIIVERVPEPKQLSTSSKGMPAASSSSSSNDSSTTTAYAGNGCLASSAGVLPVAPPAAQQQQPAAPPCTLPSTAAVAPPAPPSTTVALSERGRDRQEAAAALLRLLHEDCSASKPASDVLLFNHSSQQPIVNWVGKIKHKHAGRVVELCGVTLQVPEPFLEEFPAALFAADVRHRRSVSLGRHVVCRATLAALTEHQLAGLATMARNQLVALCSLQTSELHLVPYFDNKNIVRMVGFLKITAE